MARVRLSELIIDDYGININLVNQAPHYSTYKSLFEEEIKDQLKKLLRCYSEKTGVVTQELCDWVKSKVQADKNITHQIIATKKYLLEVLEQCRAEVNLEFKIEKYNELRREQTIDSVNNAAEIEVIINEIADIAANNSWAEQIININYQLVIELDHTYKQYYQMIENLLNDFIAKLVERYVNEKDPTIDIDSDTIKARLENGEETEEEFPDVMQPLIRQINAVARTMHAFKGNEIKNDSPKYIKNRNKIIAMNKSLITDRNGITDLELIKENQSQIVNAFLTGFCSVIAAVLPNLLSVAFNIKNFFKTSGIFGTTTPGATILAETTQNIAHKINKNTPK